LPPCSSTNRENVRFVTQGMVDRDARGNTPAYRTRCGTEVSCAARLGTSNKTRTMMSLEEAVVITEDEFVIGVFNRAGYGF
jgi:hypothetical protein